MRLLGRNREAGGEPLPVTTEDVRPAETHPAGGDEAVEHRPADHRRDVVVDDTDRRNDADHVDRDDVVTTPVLKVPTFSPIGPLAGWIAAWGAVAVASAALVEAGVALGFGFGIADGSVDLDAGFWAGLWTLVVQAGAFLAGGYIAGRMARVRAVAHAVLAWVIAMIATAADAVIVASRDGGESVLAPLRIPQWAGLDYENVVAVPLVIFAAGSLVAVIVGGVLAAGANRLETREGVASERRRQPR